MTDEYFMLQALKEAKKAYVDGEVPVGAVITIQDKIIARGHNQVERLKDPTAHAEIIALTSAFNFTGSKYLPDASIYITIEPCLMCAGALYWSKIRKVVYGGSDEKKRLPQIHYTLCFPRTTGHCSQALSSENHCYCRSSSGRMYDADEGVFQGKKGDLICKFKNM